MDDDLDDREIFQTALETLSVKTNYVEAVDGIHALDMINNSSFAVPDFIFIDLNMPRVGGLELLQALRKLPGYTTAPIYIYTTSSAQAECDRCMQYGATGFMTKHPSFDDLCDELQKLI